VAFHPIIDRHLRTVLDSVHDGVLIESGERVVFLNPAYARMLGYPSVSELYDRTIRDIADPEDFDRLRYFGMCRASGKPAPARYTFRACGRAGRAVLFDASVSATRISGEVLITTTVRELQRAPDDAPSLSLLGTAELSPQEQKVIEGVLRGLRSKEIALELAISEKTVFTHRSRAYRKLALRSDRQLFRLAADHGLI
jgi:PAS domain S-box-containing protein